MSGKETCEYREKTSTWWDDNTSWECNKCGAEWFFEIGTPTDNMMYYCPTCGRRIEKIVPLHEDIEEEEEK